MALSGSTTYSIRGHSVVFHEGPHEYYVDGVKVPSVTEILGRYSRLHGLMTMLISPRMSSGGPQQGALRSTRR